MTNDLQPAEYTAFLGPKRIASGPAMPEKRWLKKFVAGCKDTPEKRALQTLLR